MKRWEATAENGDFVTEEDLNWELVKNKVKSLALNNNGQMIKLPDNCEYIQGKTASATIGSNKIDVESRFVGIILGNKTIKIRVDEKTNDIQIEIEDETNHLHSSRRKENSN